MSKAATAKAKRLKILWMGNPDTHELHRVVEGEEHPAKCNLNLDDDKFIRFRIASDALNDETVKWDAAKWCNKRFKSRENE